MLKKEPFTDLLQFPTVFLNHLFFFALKWPTSSSSLSLAPITSSTSSSFSSSSFVFSLSFLLLLLFLIVSCSCFLRLSTAFYLFCCVIHTNRSNGERVKWKCWGPGPCSACLSAALVNRTVRYAGGRGGGINI